MFTQDLFSLEWIVIFIIYIYIYICVCVCVCAYLTLSLCVCGDNRITCYPGVAELTNEPGDA